MYTRPLRSQLASQLPTSVSPRYILQGKKGPNREIKIYLTAFQKPALWGQDCVNSGEKTSQGQRVSSLHDSKGDGQYMFNFLE